MRLASGFADQLFCRQASIVCSIRVPRWRRRQIPASPWDQMHMGVENLLPGDGTHVRAVVDAFDGWVFDLECRQNFNRQSMHRFAFFRRGLKNIGRMPFGDDQSVQWLGRELVPNRHRQLIFCNHVQRGLIAKQTHVRGPHQEQLSVIYSFPLRSVIYIVNLLDYILQRPAISCD